MITSVAGELKVEEIVPNEAVNKNFKTLLWANGATVIPKNHIGHISVNINIRGNYLCIEGRIRSTQQMIPRC